MYKLSALTSKMPAIQQVKIINSGFALWLVWNGKLSGAVSQTLLDHGCRLIVEDSSQALWFSFNEECFRALARLQIWARLNTLPVFVEVMPAQFMVGFKFELAVNVTSELVGQEVGAPNQFEVWVHPKTKDKILTIAGLDLKAASAMPGMGNAGWEQFQADPSLNYPSTMGWYLIVKPLGNPLDKVTIEAWRAYYREMTPLLERLSVKYIYNEYNLIVSIDTLRVLRSWLRETILQVKAMKDAGKGYWPCVTVGIKKGNLSFTDELPKKVSVNWNNLVPDFPHVSYGNAFMTGREFRVNEVRVSMEQTSVDDWCYVTMADSDGADERGTLNITEPKALLVGNNPHCFYCGLKSHGPEACPTRQLIDWRPEIWDRLAEIGLEDMDKAFRDMEGRIEKKGISALQDLLTGEPAPASVLTQSIFEIGVWAQHRFLRLVWRSKGKDMPMGLRQQVPMEGEYIWAALDSLRNGATAAATDLLNQALQRFPRGYQPRALQGFIALEAGDLVKAAFCWREAERMAATPLQQAYFQFLQARLLECQEEYDRASALYKQAQLSAPRWHETIYRQGVCMVKIGFTDQALSLFHDLISLDPHFFNKVLIDIELERGRVHILTGMWNVWNKSKEKVEERAPKLDKISKDLAQWFRQDDQFRIDGRNRLEALLRLRSVNNFVSFERLLDGLQSLSQDMSRRIDAEIKTVNEKMERSYRELREVYREAAWFPFPRLLKDFNRDFNASAEKLRFVRLYPLHVSDNFKKSLGYLEDVEIQIKKLRGRLVTLRIVRDGTFFILLLGRNFMWLELAGLGLSLLLLPIMSYCSQKFGGVWWADVLVRQKWQIQKGLILILSIAAMAIAALKTAIVFEKKKSKLFTEDG